MKGCLFVILALLMTATVATAQHQHGPVTTKEIIGAEHPELIPDSLAYGKFFESRSVSTDADPEVKQRVDFKIKGLRLGLRDELQFRVEMNRFRVNFDNIVKTHNYAAERGMATGDDFQSRVDQLTAETRANLQKSLSSTGEAFLELVVSRFKKNITISIATVGGVQ